MKIEIRVVQAEDLELAYQILHELREDLDFQTFKERLVRLEFVGYLLYGAYQQGLIGLIGFRPVETMARGPHIHIDDLIVTAECRGQGVGEKLLELVECIAKNRSIPLVFLDSRSEVINYYENHGYVKHSATLLRKLILS